MNTIDPAVLRALPSGTLTFNVRLVSRLTLPLGDWNVNLAAQTLGITPGGTPAHVTAMLE